MTKLVVALTFVAILAWVLSRFQALFPPLLLAFILSYLFSCQFPEPEVALFMAGSRRFHILPVVDPLVGVAHSGRAGVGAANPEPDPVSAEQPGRASPVDRPYCRVARYAQPHSD